MSVAVNHADPYGKFRRLRTAIGALLSRSSEASQLGMTDSYDAVRTEARLVVPEELIEEYDGLFGVVANQGRIKGAGSVVDEARAAQRARAKLELLHGWLSGIIDENYPPPS